MSVHDEQCELTLFAGCEHVHHKFRYGVTIECSAEYWKRPPSPTDISMYETQHKPICTCKLAALEK